LRRKWARELDYRLIKELWAYTGNVIAVRFAYEWRDDSGHWFRSYGNESRLKSGCLRQLGLVATRVRRHVQFCPVDRQVFVAARSPGPKVALLEATPPPSRKG
jgi:nuclear transport factor 2 (NTF2) superfamily protein